MQGLAKGSGSERANGICVRIGSLTDTRVCLREFYTLHRNVC